jgi:hypothetical protein
MRAVICYRAVVAAATFGLVFARLVRPWAERWGATDDELVGALAGDDLVASARYSTTRAITIDAPVSAVWPWLVQIGQGRGGLYSYDWLENIFQLGIHSADAILPEFQHLAVGDIIQLDAGGNAPLTVALLEPERALVLQSRDIATGEPVTPGAYFGNGLAVTWAFIVQPADERRTRLIVRFRSAWQPSLGATLFQHLLLEPAHFIMERGMLLGIRQRAEGSGVAGTETAASRLAA